MQDQLRKFGKQDDTENFFNVADKLQTILDSLESQSPNQQTMLLRVTLPTSARSNRLSKTKRTPLTSNERTDDEVISSHDIETTCLQSLPGNEDSHSRSKHLSKKVHHSPNVEVDLDLETVQQAFLENNMHEKIADHINKVINTPEVIDNDVGRNGSNVGVEVGTTPSAMSVEKELNSMIKTIVEQTECDPSFEKILDEIVADAADTANPPVSEESDNYPVNSWSESSTPQRPSSLPPRDK